MFLSRNRAALPALILAMGACASTVHAADYVVVVPIKGKTLAPPAIQVALRAATLPGAVASEQYAGFDFNSVLAVSGDAAYQGTGVTWSVESGALPSGLALTANGRLNGVPAAATNATFTLAAAYKGQRGSQSYTLNVAAPPAKVFNVVGENDTLTLTAPPGTVFREVVFASYGTPGGVGPNYTLGGCHATNSVALVSSAFLGKSSGTIGATNAVFGDPCSNTRKGLAVTLKAY